MAPCELRWLSVRVNRRSALRCLVAAWSSTRLPLGAQALPEPAWLLTGAVTDRSAVVKAVFVDRPSPLPPLLVSPRRDLSGGAIVTGQAVAAASETYGRRTIGEYRLDALEPATEYFAGLREGTGTLARFRTFGRGAFSFVAAFASCAGGTRVMPLSNVSNSGVFAALAALDPHVFLHMGDLHYYNITGPARLVEPVAGSVPARSRPRAVTAAPGAVLSPHAARLHVGRPRLRQRQLRRQFAHP